MDSFSDILHRPPAFGGPCLDYTDSRPGPFGHRANIQRRGPLLVAGGQLRGEGGVPGLPDAGGARCVVVVELCADDLPRDAIELAAARDALLIG
jgi:hypothetical protein